MHAYSPVPSLTDPPMESAIGDGVTWLQASALGTFATIVAVIAVAAVGLMMLSGRLALKRSATVVIGCFLLFGAAGIGTALTGLSRASMPARPSPESAPGPLSAQLRSPPPPPAVYDPYAGASVPESLR